MQKLTFTMLITVLGLTACQTVNHSLNYVKNSYKQISQLEAKLYSTDGTHNKRGEIHFEQLDEGVRVQGKVTGLVSHATYAMHIHETGLCSDTANHSGGHFNPMQVKHSHPDDLQGHAGDLPNITANAEGIATINYINSKITLKKAEHGIKNRAIVIHAKADDYISQPAGNAGERIICGVIKS